MKIENIIRSEVAYRGPLSLTDFLNYAEQIGRNVRDNELYWINEYMEYESSWKQSDKKNNQS